MNMPPTLSRNPSEERVLHPLFAKFSSQTNCAKKVSDLSFFSGLLGRFFVGI